MSGHANTHALILGGTQGLGLAIAQELRAQGCRKLVIAARDSEKGQAVAASIGAQFLPVDLGDVASVRRCVDSAAALMGQLDALCIAGASTDRGSILTATEGDFDQMFAVNTRGPFFAIQRTAQLAQAAGHPASRAIAESW